MSKKELSVKEENRYILGGRLMASEVKLGRTVFDVTSRMGNETNSFKDIVEKAAERELRRLDKNTG